MRMLLFFVLCASLAALTSRSVSATETDGWGRLFTSPAERQTARIAPGAQAIAPAINHYSGEIRSQSGRKLHLINGVPSTQSPPASVRPGESWDAQSGEVQVPIRIKVTP